MIPAYRHSPEKIEVAREMYASGARVEDIYAVTGLRGGTLYYHLDGGQMGARLTALPRRRIVNSHNVGEAMRPHASLTGLANRLQRTAARAVREIELRLTDPAQDPVHARTTSRPWAPSRACCAILSPSPPARRRRARPSWECTAPRLCLLRLR